MQERSCIEQPSESAQGLPTGHPGQGYVLTGGCGTSNGDTHETGDPGAPDLRHRVGTLPSGTIPPEGKQRRKIQNRRLPATKGTDPMGLLAKTPQPPTPLGRADHRRHGLVSDPLTDTTQGGQKAQTINAQPSPHGGSRSGDSQTRTRRTSPPSLPQISTLEQQASPSRSPPAQLPPHNPWSKIPSYIGPGSDRIR